MSGSENLTLSDLGDLFLDSGKETAVNQAKDTVSDILSGELSFMEMNEPEIIVEHPTNDLDYHARYLPHQDRIEFNPTRRRNSPELRETSIHELFHRHQDIQYFGLSKSDTSYSDAVDQLVNTIDHTHSDRSGLMNKIRKKLSRKSADEEMSQEMFVVNSIGHEGFLPSLFSVYTSKYESEIPELAREVEEHYTAWKEIQKDRNKYKHLVGLAKPSLDASEISSTESRQVTEIDEHTKTVINSTDKDEIQSHLKAIDNILDENGLEYSAPYNLGEETLTATVDASEMARYNQITQESQKGFREALINRIADKEDIQNPIPTYFQEAFAHAASIVASGLLGDSEAEEEYWENQVEKAYDNNLSYGQKVGTKARNLGEQVLEEVRDLETEKEKYKRLVEIQDKKVEDYRITV